MALKTDVSRAAREAGTEKPVDLVHLSTQTMGDRQLEKQVLGVFVAQSGIYLRTWRTAGDARARSDVAHALKGAARGIGAWHLADLAEQAETPGFDDVDRLETEVQRVCDYIRSLA
ncbi:MAG: Hpt domain-containing protein [Pseudomonadota bacterium]|nr:Hpt domain-containing protein [Pseudomonadota bacterium]